MENKNTFEQELSQSFIEYAYVCNIDRAIPDAKTGLKPVHQRVLYAAYLSGMFSNKNYMKSARLVGNTMGMLHPHGDSSIYEAAVRLALPHVLRYPLLDGHGNFGNRNGDKMAASRYTELRLEKLAEDGLLYNLKKNNIEYKDNYDSTLQEPVSLPSIFPNLLCNPNLGIGVGLASSWLPHNLREVGQAIIDYLDGKEPSVPAPDFPTGCTVVNGDEAHEALMKGRGRVVVRGNYHIKKNHVIFTEIPYEVKIDSMLESIAKMVEDGSLQGLAEIEDRSGKKGIEIHFIADKDTDPELLVKRLFASTNLQSSYSYNQIAILNKKPVELGLKDAIKIYVEHNIDVLLREVNFDIKKYSDKKHILEGLLIALEDIDNVIKLIKESKDSAGAHKALITKYGLSDIQSKAILDMKLSKLANMGKIELQNELKEILSELERLNNILSSEHTQKNEIKNRLLYIVKKYGDERRTKIENIDYTKDKNVKLDVVPEDVVITLEKNGLIRSIPLANFKRQGRGGKGVKTEELLVDSVKTNTMDSLLVFTLEGMMYKIPVSDIPVVDGKKKGIHISTISNIDMNDTISAIVSLEQEDKPQYVVFVTKKGYVKKTLLSEYLSLKKATGTKAIKLMETDTIVDVFLMNEEQLLLMTKNGYGIRFETKEINPIGRVTRGVVGVKLSDGDEVVTSIKVQPSMDLIIVDSVGKGKRVLVSDFPVQGRAGKGVAIKKSEDAFIVQAALVNDDSNIVIGGVPNSITISAKDLSIASRTSIGVILIKNSQVNKITVI